MKPSKSVVIQTSFVGDCILTLPLISRILENNPLASLDIVTTPVGAQIFELAKSRGLQKYKDKIRILVWNKKEARQKTPWGMWRWIQENILNEEAEIVSTYCVQRSFRSGLLAFMIPSRHRVGFSSGASSFFYTHAVQRDWNSGKSEIEKNLDLLRSVESPKKISNWVYDDQSPSLLKSHRVEKNRDTIAMGLGSPWPTKDWPLENVIEFIQLAVSQGIEIKLLGDSSALKKADQIKKAVSSAKIQDGVGKTTIQEWVDAVDSSSLLVSGDSATVHVASDLGVPVLALFGPTVPDFGFAPWRKPSLVLSVKDLACRPCDIHGPKVCPLGHHKCMVEIKPQKVFNFAMDYLEGRRR